MYDCSNRDEQHSGQEPCHATTTMLNPAHIFSNPITFGRFVAHVHGVVEAMLKDIIKTSSPNRAVRATFGICWWMTQRHMDIFQIACLIAGCKSVAGWPKYQFKTTHPNSGMPHPADRRFLHIYIDVILDFDCHRQLTVRTVTAPFPRIIVAFNKYLVWKEPLQSPSNELCYIQNWWKYHYEDSEGETIRRNITFGNHVTKEL